MCQSLVDKIGRSGQLMSLAHPEVLSLFEDWLEELEDEVASLPPERRATPAALGRELGVSAAGAAFLLAKMEKDPGRENDRAGEESSKG